MAGTKIELYAAGHVEGNEESDTSLRRCAVHICRRRQKRPGRRWARAVLRGVCQPYALSNYYQWQRGAGGGRRGGEPVGDFSFDLNGRYNHAPDFWTPDKQDLGPRLAFAYAPAPPMASGSAFGTGKDQHSGWLLAGVRPLWRSDGEHLQYQWLLRTFDTFIKPAGLRERGDGPALYGITMCHTAFAGGAREDSRPYRRRTSLPSVGDWIRRSRRLIRTLSISRLRGS